jgi:NAD(P)-dependent dehydrogenase (short-subunit alcohol dehydrogenase family)
MDAPVAKSDLHTAITPIAGKRVLVTGGTTGIGRAIAGLLASYDANVFIFGRHQTELRDTLEAFQEIGGKIDGIVADVAKPDDVRKVFDTARRSLGKLDILIGNAGLAASGIGQMDEDDWRYVVETNLVGAMACAREAAAWMRENGDGQIVIIGSVSAEHKGKDSSVYVATKSGLRGFAESLHKELADKGIKVTLIEPGEVGSDMQGMSPSEQREAIRKHELLRAEDIAVAIQYVVTQPERCAVTSMQIRPRIEPESAG